MPQQQQPLPPMDEVEVPDSPGRPHQLKRMGSVRKMAFFSHLRIQLQEQLKSLDTRVDTQQALTFELQEFFRRRAEVELEYSRSLDKLHKSLSLRQKELKTKRDQWNLFSVANCWQELVSETKKESKDHATLADIYNTQLVTRLSFVGDDLQRIFKQCKEVGAEAHEELLKVLHELHTSTKTFHGYQTESKQAESKLKVVEAQKDKLIQAIPKEKIERSKKIKLVDKEIQKRKKRYTDARFKALKAKNEYILCMDAANAAVQKYFVDDLSDLVDCMDLGFYQCISRVLIMYQSCQNQKRKSLQQNMDNLGKSVTALDSRLDKQKFLEANNSAFIMPKKFEFQQPVIKNDDGETTEPNELEASGFIRQELEQRLLQLHKRLESLRTESDEMWKTLETAESSLLTMLLSSDDDVGQYFIDITKGIPKQPETLTLKSRADRHETDEFHLSKFRDYMLSTNRIARLQAKYDHIRKVLGDTDQGGSSPALAQTMPGGPQPPRKVRRKRIGQWHSGQNPRLFGGSLEEYLEATNQEIPIVLKSCIRVINRYGLHHQGIFRVSGSQVEINNFKEAFEKGEDPLADMNDASDINSVAGVLKLYLRELREPLFPIVYFEQFMELADLESKHNFVMKMRDLVKSLPRPVVIVLRYLFAFLNHLSESSDENMMDPYNLAICFGPTLVPVPEDKDQVQYQNLVNELIKNVIVYADDIFPNDGGIIYEKIISTEPDEGDVGEAPVEQSQEEIDSEICHSEDDSVFLKEKDISLQIFGKSEYLEAIAQFDFTARSKREVSFKKGNSITLFSQVSGDWWKGSVKGKDGLVPDKYIMLKIRDEDKERLDSSGSGKEDFAQHRNRTSSDSFLSTQPKPLSISLSPSLHGEENRRLLHVHSPSPQPYLAVSKESLAISTSPESPSEFHSIERDSSWQKQSSAAANKTDNYHGTPTKGNLLNPSAGGTPVRSMSLAVPGVTTLGVDGYQVHQRSMSVIEDRNKLSQIQPWIMSEGKLAAGDRSGSSQGSLSSQELPQNLCESVTVTAGPPEVDQQPKCSPMKQQRKSEEFDDSNRPMSIDMEISTPKSVDNEDAPPPPADCVLPNLKPTKSSKDIVSVKVGPYSPAKTPSKVATAMAKQFSDGEPPQEGGKPKVASNIQFWEQRSRLSSGRTPDLVMDLPIPPATGNGLSSRNSESDEDLHVYANAGAIQLALEAAKRNSSESSQEETSDSSSPNESIPGSPESVVMTAAECFAKQNQCTLKKTPGSAVVPNKDSQFSSLGVLAESPSNTPSTSAGAKTWSEMRPESPVLATCSRQTDAHIQSMSPRSQRRSQGQGEARSFFEARAADAARVGIAKPQVMVKPNVLKKPSFPTNLIDKEPSSSPPQ